MKVTENTITESLQNTYLEIAYQSILEWQNKIRRAGHKRFNAFLELEAQLRKEWIYENRKPPKANTIIHWFEKDNINAAKLGCDDLAAICRIIGDPSALIAYYEDSIRNFPSETIESIQAKFRMEGDRKKDLTDLALRVGGSVGELLSEIESDLADGILEPQEKRDILAASQKLDVLNNQLKKLVK